VDADVPADAGLRSSHLVIHLRQRRLRLATKKFNEGEWTWMLVEVAF
jgi:hypothetical protein